MITTANEILIWDVGQYLRSVTTTYSPKSLADSSTRPFAIAFHPENDQDLFIVHVTWSQFQVPSRGYKASIVIQEVIENKVNAFYPFELFSSRPEAGFRPSVAETEDGSICIIIADEISHTFGPTRESPLPFPHPCKHRRIHSGRAAKGGSDLLGLLVVVKFDLRTRMFSTGSYHLPDRATPDIMTIFHRYVELSQTCIWRDQALLPVYKVDDSFRESSPSVTDLVAMSINDCSKIHRRPRKIPWYGKFGTEGEPAYNGLDDGRLSDCATAFCWIGGAQFAEEARLSLSTDSIRDYNDSRSIRGDDDFVVLFGDRGYVVWCFDENVALPIKNSEQDPILQDPRLNLPNILRKGW